MNTQAVVFEALDSDDLAKLKALLKESPSLAAAKDESGMSLLVRAHYLRKQDAIQHIAEHLSDPDIFESVLLGRIECIKKHVAADAIAVRAVAADGFSPLHLACYFNQSEAATWLLENGADANEIAANPSSLAPIHSASAVGAKPIVEQLIKHGADVNRVQAGGFTALHAATSNGDLQIVEHLLAAGADSTAKTDDGKTALDFAKEKEHLGVVERLTQMIEH